MWNSSREVETQMFYVPVNGKDVWLICSEIIPLLEEYNIDKNYNFMHKGN